MVTLKTRLTSTVHHRQHFQIHWNSSNKFFQKSGFLTVYLGDLIDFLCPHYVDWPNEIDENSIEYNNIYLVNENDYHQCRTSNYQTLLVCNRPFDDERLILTLSIAKYLPYPNVPEFEEGEIYYFVSTSNGLLSGVDQRTDGLCRTKHLKLIVYVEKSSQTRLKSSGPIVAKRTNVTFSDVNARNLFSSKSHRFNFSTKIFFSIFLVDIFLFSFDEL